MWWKTLSVEVLEMAEESVDDRETDGFGVVGVVEVVEDMLTGR